METIITASIRGREIEVGEPLDLPTMDGLLQDGYDSVITDLHNVYEIDEWVTARLSR